MLTLQAPFGIAAGVLEIITVYFYIRSIVRGETKPEAGSRDLMDHRARQQQDHRKLFCGRRTRDDLASARLYDKLCRDRDSVGAIWRGHNSP